MNLHAHFVWHILAGHSRAALPFDNAVTGESDIQRSHTEVEAQRFAALVPPHAPAMLRVATALIGRADAEDTTQDAIIRAWKSWGSLRDRYALRAWLLRITVNTCRDWQRGRFGRQQRLTVPLSDEESDTFATYRDDPGDSDHTGRLDLSSALNHLSSELRIIVVLRYHGGMDASEIGTALGLPAATVRTRLRRALGKLREQLDVVHDGLAAPAQEDRHV